MTAPATRRRSAPLQVTTTGSPLRGDLRALASLLVKLDREPPLRLVTPTPAPAPENASK